MRRLAPPLALVAALVALAGCGGGETVSPAPETVEGTLPEQRAPGESIFTAQGCGGCHVFTPAGSEGETGPNLDQLPQFAERANQPLEEFTRRSITDPNDYVEQGYQPGVMPPYEELSEDDLTALVEYLTQQQEQG